ncbi:hypothetical protein [Ktedonobacter sp. SOSP1-52]|uniref:hypothetical protein n=1 Tax=Ktedonobacter sp. SOSP1-52 TaxID=2778366 RepID=UPI0019166A85|nr:hypothetical protein [Ktedonobacter sp. SOSP1-52]
MPHITSLGYEKRPTSGRPLTHRVSEIPLTSLDLNCPPIDGMGTNPTINASAIISNQKSFLVNGLN